MVYIQELLIYICIRLSRDTYSRRGMSNMQLNDGMARGREYIPPRPLNPAGYVYALRRACAVAVSGARLIII